MKNFLLLAFLCTSTFCVNAQTPVYEYLFNGNLNSTGSQTGASAALTVFSNSSTVSYVAGRDGATNSAVRIVSNNYLQATLASLPQGTSARTVIFWVRQNAISTSTNTINFLGWGSTTPVSLANGQAFFLTGFNYANTVAPTQSSITVSGYSTPSNDPAYNLNANQPNPATGIWIHYAAVYDGTTVSLYRNGNAIINTTVTGWNTAATYFTVNASPVGIGSGALSADYDDIKIYNVAFTAAQVQSSFGGSTAAAPTPVYNYLFNNTVTTTSGNNALAGTATFTTGRSGVANTAVQLGATPLTATLAALPIGTSDRTISFWVKYPINGIGFVYRTLFMYGSAATGAAYGLTERTVNANTRTLSNNGYSTDLNLDHEFAINFTSGVWIHYAVVYTNGCAQVYRNGELLGIGSGFTWNTVGTTFYLGSWIDGTSSLSLAAYDDLAIYSAALSPNQIATIYAQSSNAVVVPIVLKQFSGNLNNQTATLQWQTSIETNASHYELEYAVDGKTFSTVNTIAANGANMYTTKHSVATNGLHYYRLKMIEKDGNFSYSKIVKLQSYTKDKAFTAQLYPTVTNTTATITMNSIKNTNGLLRVLAQDGKIVYSQTITLQTGSQTINLPIQQLSKGNYWIQVKVDNITETLNVVKL